jgi:hypothetical protein
VLLVVVLSWCFAQMTFGCGGDFGFGSCVSKGSVDDNVLLVAVAGGGC